MQITHVFEEKRDLRCDPDEVLVPEIVLGVAEKLDKGDQRAPRVWTMDEEALKKNLGHDLPELVHIDLVEEM